MNIVRTINGDKKITTIKHEWQTPGGGANVVIHDRGTGGNASCEFGLELSGGQAEGTIKMWGEWERECWIELLKQIVIELELIDQQ